MNELSSFQQRLNKLGEENQGLTGQVREGQEKLRLSNNTVVNLNREIEEFKGRVRQFSDESNELKRRLAETGEVSRRLQEADSTITTLSKEIERLNIVIESRNKENLVITHNLEQLQRRFQGAGEENNNLKRRLGEVENLTRNLNRLTDENQGLVNEVREGQDKLRLSTNQITRIVGELNEYKSRYNGLGQQNEHLKRGINEYESKIKTLEGKIIMSSSEIQRLQNVGRDAEGNKRKIVEYEQRQSFH